MKSKSFVLFFVLLVLAGCDRGAQTVPSDVSKQVFRWKLVTAWPKNLPGIGTAPEELGRLVEKMSNGRLQIKVYAAGELVPALEVFEAVSGGVAEMGHTGTYYEKGKIPEAQFFTGVPFGLTALEMNAWMKYGGGLELFRKVYLQHNIMPFIGGNTTMQMAGWFNREIRSLSDFRGLKMRIPGVAGDVLRRLGGTPVTLPGAEVYTSMKTGVVDAVEWVGPFNDLALGFYDVGEYYYYPGWHEPGSALYFGVNVDAWKALPGDLQTILRTAIAAVNADMLYEYTARNQDALKALVEEKNVKLRRLPDDLLFALREVSHDEVEKLGRSSPLAREIYASFEAFRQKSLEYARITEKIYSDVR